MNGSLFGDFSGMAQAVTRFKATLQEESNLRHKAYYNDIDDYDFNMTAEVDVGQLIVGPPFKCILMERKESMATRDLQSGQK